MINNLTAHPAHFPKPNTTIFNSNFYLNSNITNITKTPILPPITEMFPEDSLNRPPLLIHSPLGKRKFENLSSSSEFNSTQELTNNSNINININEKNEIINQQARTISQQIETINTLKETINNQKTEIKYLKSIKLLEKENKIEVNNKKETQNNKTTEQILAEDLVKIVNKEFNVKNYQSTVYVPIQALTRENIKDDSLIKLYNKRIQEFKRYKELMKDSTKKISDLLTDDQKNKFLDKRLKRELSESLAACKHIHKLIEKNVEPKVTQIQNKIESISRTQDTPNTVI